MESTDHSFFLAQQRAIEHMKEMNARSIPNEEPHSMPPVPPFVRLSSAEVPKSSSETAPEPTAKTDAPPSRQSAPQNDGLAGLFGGLNLALTGNRKSDGDLLLLLGLGYLLWQDGSDRLLLLALLYILL